jgi:hypothetical protein
MLNKLGGLDQLGLQLRYDREYIPSSTIDLYTGNAVHRQRRRQGRVIPTTVITYGLGRYGEGVDPCLDLARTGHHKREEKQEKSQKALIECKPLGRKEHVSIYSEI